MGCSAFVLLPLSCFSMAMWFSWWFPQWMQDSVCSWLCWELLHFLSWIPLSCPAFPSPPTQPGFALVLPEGCHHSSLCPFKPYFLHEIELFCFPGLVGKCEDWWGGFFGCVTGTGSWWGLGKGIVMVMSHFRFKEPITGCALDKPRCQSWSSDFELCLSRG